MLKLGGKVLFKYTFSAGLCVPRRLGIPCASLGVDPRRAILEWGNERVPAAALKTHNSLLFFLYHPSTDSGFVFLEADCLDIASVGKRRVCNFMPKRDLGVGKTLISIL